MPFVCPECRGANLTSAFRCGACGASFGVFHPGPGVPTIPMLLEADDVADGASAAKRILEALDQGTGFDAAALPPSDRPYLSALSLYAHAHWGGWVEPARPRAELGWLRRWLSEAELPPGPVLLLGAACGGEALHVPSGHDIVVLDGSIPLLAVGARVSAEDAWLPQTSTPGRYRAAAVCLPAEERARLAGIVWLAGDARQPPLPPRSFSAVVALNVLDSVTHPERVLRAAAELVAPGGSLICSSPFNWCDEVTAPVRRVDADDIVQILNTLTLRKHASGIPWDVQVHDRLRLSYALDAFWLQRDAA